MEYQSFNQLVIEHRNSMILIGALVLIFVIIGVLVVELYVRRELDCRYFKIKSLKISPTMIMLIPLLFVVIYFPIKVYQCNYDVKNESYETYIGEIEYSESSVKLNNENRTFFVGKGHEIVPPGISYGMVVYSTKSHVIVFYESKAPN